MSVPMKTGLPLGLDLPANYVIQFTALNATTGAAVTSVNVSNASLLVTNVAGGDLGGDGFVVLPPVLEYRSEE